MKKRVDCLRHDEYAAILSGHGATAQVEAWESHLAACPACRTRIEEQIGDRVWWDEVARSLRPSDDKVSCADVIAGHEFAMMAGEDLVRILGPTDDPYHLGRIGTYEVTGVIGRGGMGGVFKALDPALQRTVAIKVLTPDLAALEPARKRFAREAQAAAAVVDDHVLPIYAVAEWQRLPYLVMHYATGGNLQRRIDQHGPLELKEILRIGSQVAKGLAAAHAQGLVHRDVKPSNILLDGAVERVMLADFGLARASDDASLTRTGTIAGTPQYMSPEQTQGAAVDARSDLFGLGGVLYTMAAGYPPFRADNSYAILRMIREEEPRPLAEVNPALPGWLSAIVRKLMAKRVDQRFATAREVASLLEACLAHVQQPSSVALPSADIPWTDRARRSPPWARWAVGIASATLAFLLGIVILLETQKGTVRIECHADDVPIRIVRDTQVVEEWTLTRSGVTTRLAAGEYRIEIDDQIGAYEIVGERIVLHRGEQELVRITRTDQTTTTDSKSSSPSRSLDETGQPRAWQQIDPYRAPDFERFFPDSSEGGVALDALWQATDKDTRSDQEILETVRRGLRRTTTVGQMAVLRWIGNKYIWNKSPQNPDAIELMYHAADFRQTNANFDVTRHSAVYFGLSVVRPKTPAILRTLADLAMHVDDPNDLDRIAWGAADQRAELLTYITPFTRADDPLVRTKAEVCGRIIRGELKAFAWATEQARIRAEKEFKHLLPELLEQLKVGPSEPRRAALENILRNRLALIMDDSMLPAFEACADDPDADVRTKVAIIAGARWVWEAPMQSPEAIRLMLKLSRDSAREVRYNAVYYGLSTVRQKDDDVIARLIEILLEDREPNMAGRIAWGLRDERDRVARHLEELERSADAERTTAIREIRARLP